MEFSSDEEIRQIPALVSEFVRNILDREEPFFISDEATVYDISMDSADDLIARCHEHYRVQLSCGDLKLPFWRLLRKLGPTGKSSDV